MMLREIHCLFYSQYHGKACFQAFVFVSHGVARERLMYFFVHAELVSGSGDSQCINSWLTLYFSPVLLQ